MQLFSSLALLAVATSYVAGVSAVTCGKGTYRVASQCYYCAPGTYNNQDSPPSNGCTNAQPGRKACGDKTVNGQTCYGAKDQTQCGKGKYQTNYGASTCITCPVGHKCPTDTTTSPQACSPGEYQEDTGGGSSGCPDCPRGTYNNAHGATKCCKCCAGTYNDQTGQTHCQLCPNQLPYSSPGTSWWWDCKLWPISGVTSNTLCKDTTPAGGFAVGQGYCLPEQGSGPVNSGIYINKRSLECAKGLKRCPHLSGKGGFDCVNTHSDPESCGGCLSIDGDEGDGKDCTAIPNVSVTRCVHGQCIIKSCAKRHRISADGDSCEPVDHRLQSQRRKRHAAAISHKHFDV